MYVYVYMCIQNIHVYVYVSIRVYVYKTYTCMCMYTYTCLCMYIYAVSYLLHGNNRNSETLKHCNTLQHTATHCNTLQHTECTSGNAFIYMYRYTKIIHAYVCIYIHKISRCECIYTGAYIQVLSPPRMHQVTYLFLYIDTYKSYLHMYICMCKICMCMCIYILTKPYKIHMCEYMYTGAVSRNIHKKCTCVCGCTGVVSGEGTSGNAGMCHVRSADCCGTCVCVYVCV